MITRLKYFALIIAVCISLTHGRLLIDRGAVLAPLAADSSYAVKDGRLVLDSNYGKIVFLDEILYGDFKIETAAAFSGRFIIGTGADEFIFDRAENLISSRGHDGIDTFKKTPLNARLDEYIATEGESGIVVSSVNERISLTVNGKKVYENVFPRDTIGQLCIYTENSTAYLSSLRIEGRFEAVPQRTAVFTKGENGYASFRIPAIVRAKDGTLVAFAEGRFENMNDNGNIDIVYKLSADGGKTWNGFTVLHDNGDYNASNPCPILDEKTSRLHLIYVTYQRWGADEYCIWHRYSDDGGKSWSQPRDIKDMVAGNNWGNLHPGPGHGIQLAGGRLLVPCWVADKEVKGKYNSAVFYSDDGGDSWKWGAVVCEHSDECLLGRVGQNGACLLIRPYDTITADGKKEKPQGYKKLAFSDDGGNTWTTPQYHNQLKSVMCQSSIITDVDNNVMYIVYPASGNYGADISGPMWHSRRAGLALHTSSDNGKSWNRKKLIHPGRSAYSDVAIFSDKSLGVLFEGGRVDGYKNIYFAEVLTD